MFDAENQPKVDLDELQKYLDTEREKQEQAVRAQNQAYRDRLLEEIEERRQASALEDAKRRAAADPNNRVGEWLFDALGERWVEFIGLMRSANLTKLAATLNRIEGDRAAGLKHRDIVGASAVRAEAESVVKAERKSRIERDLAAIGIMTDVAANV